MTDATPDQNEQTRLNPPNESSDSPYPPPSLNDTCADDILKKLSRRKWLRDSTITATGVALLPSFLTGCHKDVWDKVKEHIPGGLGSEPSIPLTDFELYSAAQHLLKMNDWFADVYSETGNYEQYVIAELQAGDPIAEYKDFVINVLTNIALGIMEAAAIATEVTLPFVGPVFAIAAEFIGQWGGGGAPGNFKWCICGI
jgi:hypothetical protein